MESEVLIRPFRDGDAAAVSALIARTMRESNARDYPPDRLEALIAYFTAEKLRVLAHERDCLVATDHDAVIATAARARRCVRVHPRAGGAHAALRQARPAALSRSGASHGVAARAAAPSSFMA